MTGVTASVVGILAAFGVIGSSGSSPGPLASAVAKTADAGSSRVHTAFEVRSKKRVDIVTGTGMYDYRADLGHMDYSDGTTSIIRWPIMYFSGIPGTRAKWCAYDVSDVGGFFGAMTGFQNDPGAALVNLTENGTYKEVGNERIFGDLTTHYAGTVDLKRLSRKEPNKALLDFFEEGGPANDYKLPVDVWLREDELVQRMGTSYDAPAKGGGESQRPDLGQPFGLRYRRPDPAPA